MSLFTIRITAAGLLAAATLTPASASASTAQAVRAIPFFGCQQITGAPLLAEVCASDSGGKVRGFVLYTAGGTATGDEIGLFSCDAAGTTCTDIPASHAAALQTPSLPATAGVIYKSCAHFHVRVTLTTTYYYSGCSPLVSS